MTYVNFGSAGILAMAAASIIAALRFQYTYTTGGLNVLQENSSCWISEDASTLEEGMSIWEEDASSDDFSDVPMTMSEYTGLRCVASSEDSVEGSIFYHNITLPGNAHHFAMFTEPCQHPEVKQDETWLKEVPAECEDGYEEAGLYTSTTGFNIEENEYVKLALSNCGMYDYRSRLRTFSEQGVNTFLKIRSCAKEGTSCFPYGKIDIKTNVYYNLVAKGHGLLG